MTTLQKGKKKSVTNPNGANQWIADPRQQLFLAYYKDPKSETFSNAYQSALKAGFADNYARNILDTLPEWLRESVGNSSLLLKAERNLDEMLDLPNKVQAMGAFGPIFEKRGKGKNKVPVMVHATGLLKVKADVTKFVAERVGKKKYGLESENTGDKILIINISGQSNQRYGIDTRPSTNSTGPA